MRVVSSSAARWGSTTGQRDLLAKNDPFFIRPYEYPIPTPYYSPGPGRPPPTRGASLLGPTPAALQTRLLAYSLLLPPSRGRARAAPSAPSCPFSPGAAQWSRRLATLPGQGAALLGPTSAPRRPGEKGRSRFSGLAPLVFTPSFREDPSPTRHTREARVGVE
eukprot:scaffold53381_cov62-Phaeocystis_antarctica.AAC.7